ncbi:MAG: hypothetical protein JWQ24_5464 [Tardiphaga sp.]|nr:hypothetical protein [Tardiphaga sp.]
MKVQHTPLSSPGLTERPGTRRLLRSVTNTSEYWIPACAGMTTGFGAAV